MTTDQETIERGREARRILDSEVFQGAVTTVRDNLFEAWRQGDTAELRELCHHRIKALDWVEKQLIVLFEGGELATAKQERRNKRVRNPRETQD